MYSSCAGKLGYQWTHPGLTLEIYNPKKEVGLTSKQLKKHMG